MESLLNGQNYSELIEASKSGKIVLVRKLCTQYEDVAYADVNGKTALMHAADMGHKSIVKLLLLKGANINAQDNSGNSALMLAALAGHKAVVNVLCRNGAQMNLQQNATGATALIHAVRQQHLKVVEVLCKYGADVNIRDSKKNSPLSYASRKDKAKMVELLLTHGADINETDQRGRTALHRSAIQGHEGVASILLRKGASIHTKDIHGNTPETLALRCGHQQTANTLKGGKGFLRNLLGFPRNERVDTSFISYVDGSDEHMDQLPYQNMAFFSLPLATEGNSPDGFSKDYEEVKFPPAQPPGQVRSNTGNNRSIEPSYVSLEEVYGGNQHKCDSAAEDSYCFPNPSSAGNLSDGIAPASLNGPPPLPPRPPACSSSSPLLASSLSCPTAPSWRAPLVDKNLISLSSDEDTDDSDENWFSGTQQISKATQCDFDTSPFQKWKHSSESDAAITGWQIFSENAGKLPDRPDGRCLPDLIVPGIEESSGHSNPMWSGTLTFSSDDEDEDGFPFTLEETFQQVGAAGNMSTLSSAPPGSGSVKSPFSSPSTTGMEPNRQEDNSAVEGTGTDVSPRPRRNSRHLVYNSNTSTGNDKGARIPPIPAPRRSCASSYHSTKNIPLTSYDDGEKTSETFKSDHREELTFVEQGDPDYVTWFDIRAAGRSAESPPPITPRKPLLSSPQHPTHGQTAQHNTGNVQSTDKHTPAKQYDPANLFDLPSLSSGFHSTPPLTNLPHRPETEVDDAALLMPSLSVPYTYTQTLVFPPSFSSLDPNTDVPQAKPTYLTQTIILSSQPPALSVLTGNTETGKQNHIYLNPSKGSLKTGIQEIHILFPPAQGSTRRGPRVNRNRNGNEEEYCTHKQDEVSGDEDEDDYDDSEEEHNGEAGDERILELETSNDDLRNESYA